MKSPTSELLTVAEAAHRLKLKPCTLRKWLVQRRIPYTKIGERAVRIPREWVERKICEGWRDAVTIVENVGIQGEGHR